MKKRLRPEWKQSKKRGRVMNLMKVMDLGIDMKRNEETNKEVSRVLCLQGMSLEFN